LFDGVIDFDHARADPANPTKLRMDLNGDKLRPNDAGYQALAVIAAGMLVAGHI
jgi:hypothetical protein